MAKGTSGGRPKKAGKMPTSKLTPLKTNEPKTTLRRDNVKGVKGRNA